MYHLPKSSFFHLRAHIKYPFFKSILVFKLLNVYGTFGTHDIIDNGISFDNNEIYLFFLFSSFFFQMYNIIEKHPL